jgi:murein DD-endopeptidase MepM/ murein hydrolase activator NlpD
MSNKIKGIIIIREHTADAPKIYKTNAWVLGILQMLFLFIVIAAVALVFWWSFVFQRLITYNDMKVQNDSLAQYSQQVDSLKTNIIKINRYLEYFKMVSSLDSKNGHPPTIDEFLKDTALIASFESSDAQSEFRKIPKIRPVTGIVSRNFDKAIPHEAIDFVAPEGSPVRATADGEVARAYFDENLGNVVVLKHGDGYETLYAHCLKLLVKEGQKVVQGETIALVGNSGKTSKGVHLHYEVIKDGKGIDPETLFL